MFSLSLISLQNSYTRTSDAPLVEDNSDEVNISGDPDDWATECNGIIIRSIKPDSNRLLRLLYIHQGRAFEPPPPILKHLETNTVTASQLIQEVKGIYTGLGKHLVVASKVS